MSIYSLSEDSFLLSKVLKEKLPALLEKNPDLKFLEIGAGSGINLKTANECGVKKGNIFSTDIDSDSVKNCLILGFNCVQSDLFEKITGKFDIIAFNPPYLPLDKKEPESSRLATTGGKKGNEIILRFLKQAKKHLSESGKIFLITSSLTPEIDFDYLGYSANKIKSENLFFEKIYTWELF